MYKPANFLLDFFASSFILKNLIIEAESVGGGGGGGADLVTVDRLDSKQSGLNSRHFFTEKRQNVKFPSSFYC
jgi:hypothetical protein